MNKNLCLNYSQEFSKGNEEIEKIINSQIETYFDILDNIPMCINSYNIGDEVKLTKYHYLHGIGKNNDAVDIILSNQGIVSKEACGVFGNHAYQFVVGLWNVKNDILLKDYIKNYSGMDVLYNDINELIPYGELDQFVEKMKKVDHWLWEATSSMEIRFMPSLAKNENQIGFILNLQNPKAQKLLLNDINAKEYNKSISKFFLASDKNLDETFFSNKKNTFLNRASYVIFGIPINLIEGIIVGRKLEKENKKINELKNKYPNCYICNLDGEVVA